MIIAGQSDYECRYQIRGINEKYTSIFGVTPIQAINLALKVISAELLLLARSHDIVDMATGTPISADLIQLG